MEYKIYYNFCYFSRSTAILMFQKVDQAIWIKLRSAFVKRLTFQKLINMLTNKFEGYVMLKVNH